MTPDKCTGCEKRREIIMKMFQTGNIREFANDLIRSMKEDVELSKEKETQ